MYAIPMNGQGQYANQPVPVFLVQPVNQQQHQQPTNKKARSTKQESEEQQSVIYKHAPVVAVMLCSVLNVITCAAAIGIQVAMLCTSRPEYFFRGIYRYVYFDREYHPKDIYHYAYHGFWLAGIYVIVGLYGMVASTRKRTTWITLLKYSSLLAFVGATVAAALDGYFMQHRNFRPAAELGWSALGLNILAAVNNLILVILTSVILCRKSTSKTIEAPASAGPAANAGPFNPWPPAANGVYNPAASTVNSGYSNSAATHSATFNPSAPAVLNPQQFLAHM